MPTSFAGAHIQGVASGTLLTSHPVEMRSHERNVTQTDNASQAQKFNKLLKFNALAADAAPC
jgi:hypothetical protein